MNVIEQKYLALQFKLSTLSAEKRAHLISHLPDHTRKELELPHFPQQLLPVELTLEKLSRRVDASHFKEYLDSLPEKTKAFYIAAFPRFKQVQLTPPDVSYEEYRSEKFAAHVLKMLYKKALKGYPPPTILPADPVAPLLGDTGVPLSHLIAYLGLIDVAMEVKQIISTTTLKKLQALFHPREVTFMNKVASEKKVPILSPMNLRSFNEDEKALRKLILERGVYRFVEGIKNAPSQYHFYLIYFLPKEISDKVENLLKQKSAFGKGYEGWRDDVLETWRFLCTYSQ